MDMNGRCGSSGPHVFLSAAWTQNLNFGTEAASCDAVINQAWSHTSILRQHPRTALFDGVDREEFRQTELREYINEAR
jgi:hypothetical protein